MASKHLINTLAKVIIAAAWADGALSRDEVDSLKDLLYELTHIGLDAGTRLSVQEWEVLDMYIESPVGEAERGRLIAELEQALRWPKERQFALEALEKLVQTDAISVDDRGVVAEIKTAVSAAEVGGLAGLGKLVGGAMQRRSAAVAGAPNRERHFEDYVKNKVYFAVRQRMQLGEATLDLDDADLRKLTLAGGLMAKVAHVDREVKEEERVQMVAALRAHWGLALETAVFVTEVALDQISHTFDPYRLLRQFAMVSTEAERLQFLDVLFAVAAADGFVSHDELEELRALARGMNLAHPQYIDAKVKIPREQRAN